VNICSLGSARKLTLSSILTAWLLLGAIKPFGDAPGDNLRVLVRSDAYKGDGFEGQTTIEACGRVFIAAKALGDCVRAVALSKSFSGPRHGTQAEQHCHRLLAPQRRCPLDSRYALLVEH
jgi:hypothetical protein